MKLNQLPLMLLIVIAFFESAAWLTVTETWEEEPDWLDIVSEGFVLTFNFLVLFVLQQIRLTKGVYWPLFVGFAAMFMAGLPDLIDEFIDLESNLAELQENLGPPFGMVFVLVGLYRWVDAYRIANLMLKEGQDKYRELSITDGLSGLFNSTHFYQVLADEMKVARLQDRPLSILLMDIDNFKSHNDQFGHLEGDKVIAAFGQVLKRNLRDADQAFRYGGEEFMALLPKADAKVAQNVAERIRMAFEAINFEPIKNHCVYKTVSIGVTELAESDSTYDLVRRVDQAMYKAKSTGKNRFVYIPSAALRDSSEEKDGITNSQTSYVERPKL